MAAEVDERLIFSTCVNCGAQLRYGKERIRAGYLRELSSQARTLGWYQDGAGWHCPKDIPDQQEAAVE